MVITYHGGQCVKVSSGDTTLVFDPISKNSTLPAVRFGADITLVSRNHPDMNGVAEVSTGNKEPFLIRGPGEYEYKSILIRGHLSHSMYGTNDKIVTNTIYTVELEGVTLVHLGALSDKELPREMRETINGIGVLFIPITGNGALTAQDAYTLSMSLEPHIIIPLYKSSSGNEDALKHFLKEEGSTAKQIDKITLKKKDILEESSAIIIL